MTWFSSHLFGISFATHPSNMHLVPKKGSSSYHCSSFGIFETYKFVAAHLSLQNPTSTW
uniref:Uncharacterized protein n=1 Tax=Zea mays TaxID=4577 RepID=B6UCA8_MAIZE|nr:hypothetical protein [Zea mays]